jgi:hypothetical protein
MFVTITAGNIADNNDYYRPVIDAEKRPDRGDGMAKISDVIRGNFQRLVTRYGTQERLGEAIKLSQPQISNLLNQKGMTQLDRLSERLEAAGIDPLAMIQVPGQVGVPGLGSEETAFLAELGRVISQMHGTPRQKLVEALAGDARLWASMQQVTVDEVALRLTSGID